MNKKKDRGYGINCGRISASSFSIVVKIIVAKVTAHQVEPDLTDIKRYDGRRKQADGPKRSPL
jgi:hypothetical protein